MKPEVTADAVLLAHMRECMARIREYTGGERARFDASRLVQDAVVRNLQTLTEASQRLSDTAKDNEPDLPWRELAGFRNVIVHGYLGWIFPWSGPSSNTICQRSPQRSSGWSNGRSPE